ncbi:MAG: GHKL domain-containing protein [Clostridiales bacterium]
MIIFIEKFVFSGIESLLLLKLFDSFLVKNDHYLCTGFIFLALTSVSILTPMLILKEDIFYILYSIFIFILLSIICYKDFFVKKICATFMLYTIVISIKILSRRLVFIVYLKNYLFEQTTKIFFESFLSCLILILIYNILKKIIPSFSEIISNKLWLILSLISVTTFISTTSSLLLFNISETIANITMKNNLYAILLVILYLVGIISIFYLIKILSNIERLTFTNQQLNIQIESSKYVEKNQFFINKLLHDTRNHLAVVNSYLYDKDFSMVKDYLDKITYDLSNLEQKRYCENTVVNSIINIKMLSILELNITLNIDIALPKNLKIRDHDLSIIFCNTIDNAIEACRKVSSEKLRFIKLKTLIEKNFFVYKIENFKNDEIKKNKGNFITNKNDKLFHGYGISIIKSVVHKYDGNIDIRYDEKYFSILIVISIL